RQLRAQTKGPGGLLLPALSCVRWPDSVVLEERRNVVGGRAAVDVAFATRTVLAVAAGRTVVAIAARAAVTVAAAFAARAAIAITAATAAGTAVAVTARATVTPAALARFAGRTGVLQLGAGFLVDDAHRQADLAARVDLED